jgi:hypothetical protein
VQVIYGARSLPVSLGYGNQERQLIIYPIRTGTQQLMKIIVCPVTTSREMAKRIYPFTPNDEIIDNSILEDIDPIHTDAEVTATRTRYIAEYSQQKLNDIHSHL